MSSSSVFLRLCLAFTLLGATLVTTTASAQRCVAPEVMIVVDRSSSMAASRSGLLASGHSKWGAAREAIATLADGYAERVDFGVTVYPAVDGANSCDPGLVTLPVGPNLVGELMSAVPAEDPPYAGNWTATAQTLDALLAEGFVMDPDTTRERHVILITDGEQCCYDGGSTCLAAQRFWPVDSIVRLREMDIVTHVIGFGRGVDALTLNRAAVAAGTAHPGCDRDGTDAGAPDVCYSQADDLASLHAALAAIAREVTDELCDGFDNDCDGVVDNGYDRDADTYTTCGSNPSMPGEPPSNERRDCDDGDGAVHPGAEEVCNGIDDDCDGTTDPGCDCTTGETRACGSDIGMCEEGTQTCVMGAWSECGGGVGPATGELCDGVDADCDGDVDEDAVCDPGSACFDGACVPVSEKDAGCACSANADPREAAGNGALIALGLLGLWLRRRRR